MNEAEERVAAQVVPRVDQETFPVIRTRPSATTSER
jgi:hypothetical protein